MENSRAPEDGVTCEMLKMSDLTTLESSSTTAAIKKKILYSWNNAQITLIYKKGDKL